MKRIFVVDVMAMAFRNFYAPGKQNLRTSSGLPTSSIFGSAAFLLSLIEDEKPDILIMASDTEGPNFRHSMYPEYKANRGEMPENLAVQIPELFRMFQIWGLPILKKNHLEADDLIGAVAKQWTDPNTSCYIVSGDKDFMQLIDERIFLYQPKSREIIDADGVRKKFGCRPDQVTDVLAIWGDNSDNVPGVRGIGEKGATNLIRTWGSLEGIYENLDRIGNKRQVGFLQEQKEMAFLSRKLVTIKTDEPLEIKPESLVFDPEKALTDSNLLVFFEKMEFKSLAKKIQNNLMEWEKSHKKKPDKDPFLAASSRGNYRRIRSEDELKALIPSIETCTHLAFDTETTGLDLISDRPVGISLSWGEGEACYIPLNQEHAGRMDPQKALKILRPVFERPSGPVKIAHNLKFDLIMMKHLGIQLRGPLGDSMILAFVLDSSREGFGIDALSLEELGIRKIPTTALMGPKKKTPIKDADPDKLAVYACEDADCCRRLYIKMLPNLSGKRKDVYYNIDMKSLPVLAGMEVSGIALDSETLVRLSKKLLEEMLELQKSVYEEAGEEFNINSPQQLRKILFEKLKIHEKLGVTRIKRTKSGYSTDVSVLESLAGHPLPATLLTYREVTKLKNTYVDTLPRLVNASTGRIHTSFHPTGTATGRLSSSGPNLQNIPVRTPRGRLIRSAFVSCPGSILTSADYSQIELRLLAHLSNDRGLKDAFSKNQDIHISTAAQMFKKSPKEVTGEDRSRAKAINYGITYGMGPQRLAKTTGVSQSIARDFIVRYFESFPGIKTFIDEAVAFASEHGYSETISGRRRPIKGLDGRNGALALANAKNIAVNSPIQGSAADLIKLAMIAIDQELKALRMQSRMLLQVHDELVFEGPYEEASELCRLVCDGMEHAMALSVPLKVDIGSGKNWLEAH